MGVHPVLGAFVVGAVIAFVFARSRSASSSSDEPEILLPPTPQTRSGTPVQYHKETALHAAQGTVKYKGRIYDFPSEVMDHIRAGAKIEAIKVLRSKTGIDLKTAKEIVDRAAAMPAKQ